MRREAGETGAPGDGSVAGRERAVPPHYSPHWHHGAGEREARGGRERGGALAAAGEREARGGRETLACGSAWKKREKELKGEGKKGKKKGDLAIAWNYSPCTGTVR